jgi:hypothetical protein
MESFMELLKRFLSGDLERTEIRRYLIFMTGVFWGLIFLAWLGYPAEHKYSITTHTFSFLGSYNEEHSPQWWWLFSIAMLFWSVRGHGAGAILPPAFQRNLTLGRLGGRDITHARLPEHRAGGHFPGCADRMVQRDAGN